MDQKSDHEEFMVITNHPKILLHTIDLYNDVYNTDFKFVRFVRDTTCYAIVSYAKATDFDIFRLASQYGTLREAYDKGYATNMPAGFFDDKQGWSDE